MTDIRNVAIYVRVSSEDQLRGRELTSIDAQKEECIRYVAEHYGETVLVGVYEDAGVSAKDMNRPGLQSVIADIKRGKIDILIVHKWSRLVREPFDSMLMQSLCKESRVLIRCASEDHVNQLLDQRQNAADPMTAMFAEMMLFHLDQMQKFERVQASLRTRGKMTVQARHGMYNGGGVPFGFRRTATKGIEPDPILSRIVVKAFDVFVSTRSLARTRDYLNRVVPSESRRRWNTTTTRSLIERKCYIGSYVWADIEIPKFWDPVVDLETWARAQEALRKKVRVKTCATDSGTYHLRGLVRCPACGGYCSPFAPGNRPTRYYRCNRSIVETKHSCPVRMVNADALHRSVLECAKRLSDASDRYLKSCLDTHLRRHVDPNLDRELAAVKSKLVAAQAQIANLVDALADGASSVRAVAAKLQELERNEADLKSEVMLIETALNGEDDRLIDLEQARAYFRNLPRLWELMPEDERTEFFQQMVEGVELTDKTQCVVTLQVPDTGAPSSSFVNNGSLAPRVGLEPTTR